jgi:hypothetical protein
MPCDRHAGVTEPAFVLGVLFGVLEALREIDLIGNRLADLIVEDVVVVELGSPRPKSSLRSIDAHARF